MEFEGVCGPRIHRLTAYLKYEQHVSYDRLKDFFSNWFDLQISEGGIDNILRRMGDEMHNKAEKIREQVKRAEVIGSDETGVRVDGKNWWKWVFQTDEASYHTIVDSRSGSVIEQALSESTPTVWQSDLYSSQMSAPANEYQICLAYQQRDLQYAMDCGDEVFAPNMKEVFAEAMRLNEEVDWQEGYTYKQKKEKRRIRQDFWG